MHVLFHHESAYRHAVVGTPSAVLHIHCDGDFGVVHRRKSHEYGVVATVVLRRTGLAARLKVVFREHSARSAESRRAHSCHHIVVCPTCGLGVVAARIGGVERFALHLPHHMWGVVVAAVGYRCAEIGYLQRRERHLSLPDRNTDYGQTVP